MATAFDVDSILVPTDFSEPSENAVRVAASLAERFGAKLHILHVWAPPVAVAFDGAILPSAEQLASYTDSLERELNQLQGRVQRPAQTMERHLVQGIAWREICDYAERKKIGLVVMGTHGRSGFSHLVMGSVAERVVRASKVPVMVVPSAG